MCERIDFGIEHISVFCRGIATGAATAVASHFSSVGSGALRTMYVRALAFRIRRLRIYSREVYDYCIFSVRTQKPETRGRPARPPSSNLMIPTACGGYRWRINFVLNNIHYRPHTHTPTHTPINWPRVLGHSRSARALCKTQQWNVFI